MVLVLRPIHYIPCVRAIWIRWVEYGHCYPIANCLFLNIFCLHVLRRHIHVLLNCLNYWLFLHFILVDTEHVQNVILGQQFSLVEILLATRIGSIFLARILSLFWIYGLFLIKHLLVLWFWRVSWWISNIVSFANSFELVYVIILFSLNFVLIFKYGASFVLNLLP